MPIADHTAYIQLLGWRPTHPVTDLPGRRRLHSASSLAVAVPSTRLRTIGDRAFPAAASRTWNSLPREVTSSTTLSTFKSKLKTYLFSLSCPEWSLVFSVQWPQCSALFTLYFWLIDWLIGSSMIGWKLSVYVWHSVITRCCFYAVGLLTQMLYWSLSQWRLNVLVSSVADDSVAVVCVLLGSAVTK